MQVQLPDGSQKEVPDNATVADVAASIGRRLAKDAIAGKVNGKVVDVYTSVPAGAKIEIVTPKSEEGLDTIRHSTAHLMAMAVQELFPGTQVTIGPVIENGFFYDFGTDRPFSDEDLRRIEAKMQEIVEGVSRRRPHSLPHSVRSAVLRGLDEGLIKRKFAVLVQPLSRMMALRRRLISLRRAIVALRLRLVLRPGR